MAVKSVAATSDVRGIRDALANGSETTGQQRRKMRPRCRVDTGKYVVEWRPPLFLKKLFGGTYENEEDAWIACDVMTFHTKEEEEQLTREQFYYSCSLELFNATEPALSINFSSLKPDCKGDSLHCDFTGEMRERAQFWIEHNRKVCWTESAHSVSDDNQNASTSQAGGQQVYCQQTSADLTDSFGGHGIPAVAEGDAHAALFSTKGAEKMQEAAPTDDLHEPNWNDLSDLEIVRKYPELSNQHCNLPSHITRETEAVLSTTSTTTQALPAGMMIVANDVLARLCGLPSFELEIFDDLKQHEGGQNLQIKPTLDAPFKTSGKRK